MDIVNAVTTLSHCFFLAINVTYILLKSMDRPTLQFIIHDDLNTDMVYWHLSCHYFVPNVSGNLTPLLSWLESGTKGSKSCTRKMHIVVYSITPSVDRPVCSVLFTLLYMSKCDLIFVYFTLFFSNKGVLYVKVQLVMKIHFSMSFLSASL